MRTAAMALMLGIGLCGCANADDRSPADSTDVVPSMSPAPVDTDTVMSTDSAMTVEPPTPDPVGPRVRPRPDTPPPSPVDTQRRPR
ncbi:MAG TPA: hypothetical protein VGE02_14870 [Gemmatimonadales bacterium]